MVLDTYLFAGKCSIMNAPLVEWTVFFYREMSDANCLVQLLSLVNKQDGICLYLTCNHT